jgi:S-layer protein (TIGR01567 family)
MPGFTEVENSIIKAYIKDSRLINSLASIREAMESIWAIDAPRIVQNYTDHGERHSERVAEFIEKLLQVNPDIIFSHQETYLLLAGVYLHDIGMQCDVVKYPEIRTKAENLGAKFTVEFKAKTANSYSDEEQKEIRNNHNFLSAAWIDYLYEAKNDVLHHAIRSIPDDLVDDLMDVCKYHSQLQIIDCDDTFRLDTTKRKRLVAALLRLADELDISSSRVELDTVKIFALNPDNSVYWWLHNYTKVNFIRNNKIHITVRLHPEDFELFGTYIREDYITKFKRKNLPVLEVLIEYNIPVIIDSNSDVVVHKRAEKFPHEITDILNKKNRGIEAEEKARIEADMPAATEVEKLVAVIFTALPVEYKAVRSHLECIEEKMHPTKGTIYDQGIFTSNGRSWKVVIAEIGKGNVQVALEVERAIEFFKPNIVLFVGVAGGIKSVKLGDVVVANKIYGYESGKADYYFKPRPAVCEPKYAILQRVNAEARKGDWLQRLSEILPDQHPTVFIEPIAAGEKVLNSTQSEFYKLIKSNYEDAVAVEMEGYGFLKAAYANSQVDALVIRGISDLIDGKEAADKAGSQKTASLHASAFAFEILSKTYMPNNFEQKECPEILPPEINAGKEDKSSDIRRQNEDEIKFFKKEGEVNLEKKLEILENTQTLETLINPYEDIEFVLIPAGRFMMGSSKSAGTFQFVKDIFKSNELPIHEVKFEHHFYLGKFPITQKQWNDVMGNNPSKYKGDTHPVERISWDDAQEFITKLNKMEGNELYRLPSEAEWEYACRAFTQTKYSFGDDLSNMEDYAWFKSYSGTHPVGEKKSNPLGLYDMHGNVWEWTQDSWHDSYNGAPSNGSSWENGDSSDRVLRGGSFADFAGLCRSASRLRAKPSRCSHDTGFRLLRELSVASESTAISDSNCLVPVIATSCNFNYWGWYLAITLFGEKYTLIKYDDASKLAKLLLDSNLKYALKKGEKLDLFGYAIEAKQIDVDGKKVWLEFTKDGQYVDDNIISINISDKDSDFGSNTWTCKLNNIQGENSTPVMKIHVGQAFHGAIDSIVLIDGLWLIDYSNAMTLNVGDKLGHFKLVKINNGVDESNLGSLIFEPDYTQDNVHTISTEESSTTTEVTPISVSKVSSSSHKYETTTQFSKSEVEEWRNAFGIGAGEIYVSDHGSVKDADGKLLQMDINEEGYNTVNIDGKPIRVDYLVACAFLPCPNGYVNETAQGLEKQFGLDMAQDFNAVIVLFLGKEHRTPTVCEVKFIVSDVIMQHFDIEEVDKNDNS